MKILINAAVISSIVCFLWACESTPLDKDPEACIDIKNNRGQVISQARVNDTVFFVSCSKETPFFSAVWTGDSTFARISGRDDTTSHNYASYGISKANGFTLNRAGSYRHFYKKPGTYNVTFIASTAPKRGQEVKRAFVNKTITITP